MIGSRRAPNPELRSPRTGATLGVEMLATRTLDELSVEDIAHEAGIDFDLFELRQMDSETWAVAQLV